MRTRTLATEGVALRLGFGKQRSAVVAHSSREPESVGGGGEIRSQNYEALTVNHIYVLRCLFYILYF